MEIVTAAVNAGHQLTLDAALVLRRPPLGHVLPTAHDMTREHRVLAALGQVRFPVPRVAHLCTDTTVIGAPFYLMEHVDGTIHREPADLERLGPDRVRGIARPSWTPWPGCTPWNPPVPGWPTSGARTASTPGRYAAGNGSSTRPAAATCPASTSCTTGCAAGVPAGVSAPSCTVTTGWTTSILPRTTRCARCSTGRCRPSATRSVTWR